MPRHQVPIPSFLPGQAPRLQLQHRHSRLCDDHHVGQCVMLRNLLCIGVGYTDRPHRIVRQVPCPSEVPPVSHTAARLFILGNVRLTRQQEERAVSGAASTASVTLIILSAGGIALRCITSCSTLELNALRGQLHARCLCCVGWNKCHIPRTL